MPFERFLLTYRLCSSKNLQMGNKKRVEVEETFINAVFNKLKSDKKVLPLGTLQDRIADRINNFIHDELQSFDKNLHQRVHRIYGGNYPGPKTISRAFITERLASVDLLNVCGWYLFKEDWSIENKQFNFTQKTNSTDASDYPTQATNITAGKDLTVKVKNTAAKIYNVKAGRNIHIDIGRD